MGKIDTPTETTEKSGPKVSEHAEEQAENIDDFFSTERTREALTEDKVEIDEDDLKLTNEAVRLIHLKKELGIDATNTDNDKQIKKILDWARNSGIKNRNQLYSKIKEIKYKLGITEFDGNALERIHQYVTINDQITKLVNKQQALENDR
jgi:hypothetical protein